MASSMPGGSLPGDDSQVAAAPRAAISRAAATATPDTAAHNSASDHSVPGAAGFFGGSSCLAFCQPASSALRTAIPVGTANAKATIFQPILPAAPATASPPSPVRPHG